MGFLINPIEQSQFVTYTTIIESKDLKTMGSIPVVLNCYDNSQSTITNKIFIPLACTLRQLKPTISYNFLANDHLVIEENPGTYFFFKDNILRGINDYVYTSLYYQQTHNRGGANIITNIDADKLTSPVTLTTNTGNDATIGNGDLLVSIAGYLMNI
jgi:hypothetical protein